MKLSSLFRRDRSGRDALIYTVTFCVLAVIFIVSLGLGHMHIPPLDVARILLSRVFALEQTWPDEWQTVVFTVRLPRLCAAVLVGAALAASGACYQTLFHNPLVSPDILGASTGAGLGAAISILFGLTAYTRVFAFVGGMLAVGLTYLLSRVYRRESTVILVLAGVIVGSFFSSILSFIKSVADTEDVLPAITYWLMGSIANTFFRHITPVLLPMIVSFAVIIALSWRMNLLSLNEVEAKALGVNLTRMRGIVILFSTLLTASAVCISGTIGWVGLVIPHVARMVIGADSRKMLPLSMAFGAAFLIVIDDFARTLVSHEIQLGILTGLIGAPFFALILLQQKKKVAG